MLWAEPGRGLSSCPFPPTIWSRHRLLLSPARKSPRAADGFFSILFTSTLVDINKERNRETGKGLITMRQNLVQGSIFLVAGRQKFNGSVALANFVLGLLAGGMARTQQPLVAKACRYVHLSLLVTLPVSS